MYTNPPIDLDLEYEDYIYEEVARLIESIVEGWVNAEKATPPTQEAIDNLIIYVENGILEHYTRDEYRDLDCRLEDLVKKYYSYLMDEFKNQANEDIDPKLIPDIKNIINNTRDML